MFQLDSNLIWFMRQQKNHLFVCLFALNGLKFLYGEILIYI